MARKMMYREVTKTTVKCAKLTVEEGTAKIENLEDEVIIGNISQEAAQKQLNKKYGQAVTILEIFTDTATYEMSVEDFIKVATIKLPEVEEAE